MKRYIINVSEIEYLPYLLLRYHPKLKKAKKQEQLFDTIITLVSIYYSSSDKFGTAGKKAIAEIKRISGKVSSEEILPLK